eukprot:SAG31_NODE_5341_length_2599_cov_1.845600_3_plen_157_part_00
MCPERYGDIRLIGSAAFGFAAFGGGALMDLVPPAAMFPVAMGVASAFQAAMVPMINRLDFSALHVQKKPPGVAEESAAKVFAAEEGKGKEKAPAAKPKISDLLKELRDPKLIFMIMITFMGGWQSTLIDTFFNGKGCYFLVFVPTIREIQDFYREM